MAEDKKNFAIRADAASVDEVTTLMAQLREHMGLDTNAELLPVIAEDMRGRLSGTVAPSLSEDQKAIRGAMSVISARVDAIVTQYAGVAAERDQHWQGQVYRLTEVLDGAKAAAEAAQEELAQANKDKVAADAAADDLRSQLEQARERIAELEAELAKRDNNVMTKLDQLISQLS